MSTDVVMPQMGESIAEGTIVRWIKKVGDPIDKDEPLFEISTDKVDAEIPSPGAGVLLEIKVKEGETVPVNSVVAVIGAAGREAGAPARQPRSPARGAGCDAAACGRPTAAADAGDAAPHGGAPAAARRACACRACRTRRRSTIFAARDRRRSSARSRRSTASTSRSLNGTGISGRVTKKDITAFIESGGAAARAGAPAAARARRSRPPPPAFQPGENVRIEKMGVMRKKIAEHMVMSIHTSPHVYSAYEVDFSRIDELRKKKKAEYEARGHEADLHGVHRQGDGRHDPRSFRSRTRRSTARTSSTSATSTSALPSRSSPG